MRSIWANMRSMSRKKSPSGQGPRVKKQLIYSYLFLNTPTLLHLHISLDTSLPRHSTPHTTWGNKRSLGALFPTKFSPDPIFPGFAGTWMELFNVKIHVTGLQPSTSADRFENHWSNKVWYSWLTTSLQSSQNKIVTALLYNVYTNRLQTMVLTRLYFQRHRLDEQNIMSSYELSPGT